MSGVGRPMIKVGPSILTKRRNCGGGGGSVPALEFLLRDEFTSAESAPITSPRTCEPGPGTLTVVQTGNEVSIAGGALVMVGTSTNYGDPRALVAAGLSREIGRTLLLDYAYDSPRPLFGWSSSATTLSGTAQAALRGNSGPTPVGSNSGISGVDSVDSSRKWGLVLRSTGAYMIDATNSKLLWVWADGNAATVYPMLTTITGGGADYAAMRIADLGSPWTDDYGIATQREAGSVAEDTAFVHEADCLIEWVETTIPGPGQSTRIAFRIQDASNFWRYQIASDGDIFLVEVVAGSPTTRASSQGGSVSTDGSRHVIVAEGSTIKCYVDGSLKFTYASASNFATETDGELEQLADSVVSDLVTWPRTLSGEALTQINLIADP